MSYDPYESLRRLRQVSDEAIGQLAPAPVQEMPQMPEVNMGPYAPAVGTPGNGINIPKLLAGMPMFKQGGGVSAAPKATGHFPGDGHNHPIGGNWVPLTGRFKGDPGLAAAFQQASSYAGVPIRLNSAGRSHSEQQHLYATKPGLAAKPGHSLHEKGLAIDVDNWRDPKVKAALERAGFRQFNARKEPWHFSYGPKVG